MSDKPDLKLVEPPPVHPDNPQILPSPVLGTLIFVMTEAMMFGGFISAHGIAKGSATVWPPPGQPRLPVEITGLNSLILLASGALIYVAGKKFAESPELARRPLLGSLLLGSTFVAVQGFEWFRLLQDGLYLTVSTHASFFYLIVGTHALHAMGGLIVVAVLYSRLSKGTLETDDFQAGRLFWYFVTGLWPVLYWAVYL